MIATNAKSLQAFTSPDQIHAELLRSLDQIDDFEDCVLFDYPDFFNIGDHLIWLGLIRWIVKERRAKIGYVSSHNSFSAKEFKKTKGNGPIIFTGGGNLGDLWPAHEKFREYIISRYPDRPIVIMPQSLYFTDTQNLERAKKIFNRHPNLTVVTRDDSSILLAQEHFTGCKVFKAPDLAFQLSPILKNLTEETKYPLLFLDRADREMKTGGFSSEAVPRYAIHSDWPSMTRASRWRQKIIRKFPFLWRAPSISALLKSIPNSWLPVVEECREMINLLPKQAFHLRSLHLSLIGIHQLNQFQMVISNRLHGHILCVLLGKENVLLPNSYHKNQAFFNAWTKNIPYTCFNPSLTNLEKRIFASKEAFELKMKGSQRKAIRGCEPIVTERSSFL